MSSPSNIAESPITDRHQLVEYLASGGKPVADWRIGTEHEKFGFRLDDLRPPTFDGPQGIEALLQAMWSIWASTDAANVRAYLQQMGRDPCELKMAVIVQEMVEPIVSGVAFSKDPMTGLDEIVVEAVRGRGDQLVQGPPSGLNQR